MAHIPVNHHLRPMYRVIAGACGLYVLLFGVVGLVQTRNTGMFQQHDLPWVLGLKANRAFAILSVVAGAIILGGAMLGRNVDHLINLVGGTIFVVAGMAMMIVMQTGNNFLGFSMSTCIVSFIIGLLLVTAGLYGKTGTGGEADVEEVFRHGGPAAKPGGMPTATAGVGPTDPVQPAGTTA
jgi:hypothetical protein